MDTADGDSYQSYGGKYRTESVGAGLHTFTPPDQVPVEMARMVQEYNDDLDKAAADGELDPYEMAAKYCHKFVNIHPFLDGNGRTCRIILNSILLKYAGVVVPLGETESARVDYLALAARSSMGSPQDLDLADEDEDEWAKKPWGELSYVILLGAKKSMQKMATVLSGESMDDEWEEES